MKVKQESDKIYHSIEEKYQRPISPEKLHDNSSFNKLIWGSEAREK